MTGIGAIAVAPMSTRVAEIRSRFEPSTARAQTGVSATAASFASVLSTLGATDTGTGAGSIGTSSLSKALEAVTARSALTARASASSDATGATGADAVEAAKKYLGVPYQWGGTDPAKGLDCSGLVQRVYRELGVELPRVSYDQAKAGTAVASLADARPGDLIAFGSPVNHIAIYVGDGKILHAPRTGDVVKISDIHRPITAIRRVVPESLTGQLASTSGAAPSTATNAANSANSSNFGIGGAEPYAALFQAAAERYGLNPRLLAAVAKVESNFNPNARSGAGAAGLMQFMPATARDNNIDPYDPAQIIPAAARLLRSHLDRFGSIDLALAAYNAGPGAVQRAGGVPPYTETRNYVSKVLGLLNGESPTDGAPSNIGVLT